MQIATLTYQYKPDENQTGDNRARLQKKHLLTTIRNVPKKTKQRQTINSDLTTYLNQQLPPIRTNEQRRNSMRIKGSSLASSKIGERSTHSFTPHVRTHSRLSNKSEHVETNSRSNTPGAISRSNSRLVRMKFGYPIKLRSADFYAPDKNESELHLREDSFVNDSIRSSHQSRRASIIPQYNALDDPHLRRFFQTPIVLDVVRKTLNMDGKQLAKIYQIKKRSKSNDPYDKHAQDYQRIISKGSSGYAKLNGYDCIPSSSPARRSKTVEPSASSSLQWSANESRLQHDKSQISANTSMTSYPTSKQRKSERSKYSLKRSVRKSTGKMNNDSLVSQD